MKKTSIVIIIVGIAITIFCIVYFRPAINVADSDSMTVGPNGVKTSEWPLFIGILTTFVGICFYFIGAAEEDKKANK